MAAPLGGGEQRPPARRVVGRKIRILALHGSASNSNIIKFQLSHLRRLLGKDAEWLVPDGQEPWEPVAPAGAVDDPVMRKFFQERDPFEKRIAQGKPFVSWYGLDIGPLGTTPSPASFLRACGWLMEYLKLEAPVDVVVTHSQASTVVDRVAWDFVQAGEEPPWLLSLLFSPSPTASDLENSPLPTVLITSPEDLSFGMWEIQYRRHYTDIQILDHQDGHGFPVSQPRAAEIYERLAGEVRRRCGLVGPEAAGRHRPPGGAWVARLTQAQARAAEAATAGPSPGEPQEDDAAEVVELPDAAAISPEELAGLLRARACVVLLASPTARAFPGARADLDFATLDMLSQEAWARLAELRSGGRRLVAASVTGGRCREYCALLLGRYRLPAGAACWLRGGLRAWDAWELQNPAAASEVRLAHGLAALPGSGIAAIEPEELAAMLRERSCLVLDAREAAEARHSGFPGAERGLGFLMLRRKPQAARRRLEELRADGRRAVAISVTGGRCQRYCAMLVEQFGFQADGLCWLRGGVASWEEWELGHQELGEELRDAYDLPPSRGRRLVKHAGDGAVEAARSRSLELLA